MHGSLVLMLAWLVFLLGNYYGLWRMYSSHGRLRKHEFNLPHYMVITQQLEYVSRVSAICYGVFTYAISLDRSIRREDVSTYIFLICYWLILRRLRQFLQTWEQFYASRQSVAS